MEIGRVKVNGKIGKLYFGYCPNCRMYLVFTRDDSITCNKCRSKYIIEYPEG